MFLVIQTAFQFVSALSIGPFNFNGFDVAVLVLLLISLLMAAGRGIFREIVSLLALVIAAAVTLFVWGQYRFAAQDFISPAWLADGALVIGVGALSFLLMVFLLSGVVKRLKGKDVGIVDRLLGAAFGVGRGLLIASLGVIVLTAEHRASLEASDFKEFIEQNTSRFPPEVIAKMPKSMRDQMSGEVKPLPAYLQGSTFYPLLNTIGNGIRALPFARMRSYADRIKDGDFDAIAKDIAQ